MARLVRVVRRWQEAERVFGFELASADGETLPPFSPGSHIDVHLPAGVIRQYSLIRYLGAQGGYEIAVLNEASSRGGSRALCEKVRAGDTLKISDPRNHFPLGAADHTILLAGGIGITPILCMAGQLASAGASFELHYCARTQASMAFRDRIANSDLSAHAFLHFDDGADAQRLNLPSILGPGQPGRHAYVCGPPGFLEFACGTARGLGWAKASVHFEYFSPPAEAAAQAGAGFEVVLAKSGLTAAVREDESIVEALARHGLEVPVSCEQGVCGTCLTRVIEGEIDHQDYVLSDAEREANDQILLCCSRALSTRLVLDL